ncbi:MAG: hypothetical protein AB7T18_09690, partial [Alphaproteobacteria bacterium]
DGEIISLGPENQDIDVTWEIDEGGILHVNPFLLNPRERIFVRLIILDQMPKIDVNARIIGGSVMSYSQFQLRPSQRLRHAFPMLSSASFLLPFLLVCVVLQSGLVLWLIKIVSRAIHVQLDVIDLVQKLLPTP